MSHEHRSPKRFLPPKAWRTRNWSPPATPQSLTAILKECYPDIGRPYKERVYPKWADIAYARHWMTHAQRHAVSWTEDRPGLLETLYESSPMFAMIPRSA